MPVSCIRPTGQPSPNWIIIRWDRRRLTPGWVAIIFEILSQSCSSQTRQIQNETRMELHLLWKLSMIDSVFDISSTERILVITFVILYISINTSCFFMLSVALLFIWEEEVGSKVLRGPVKILSLVILFLKRDQIARNRWRKWKVETYHNFLFVISDKLKNLFPPKSHRCTTPEEEAATPASC